MLAVAAASQGRGVAVAKSIDALSFDAGAAFVGVKLEVDTFAA
ncbi:protein of unknown function [Paraburkholderia dioscoreae]|uniref:Uncharacterized protein n=1 Tax=Paraburkholderia dioscoreae TaxID=2604047 RepID=A0A5Q4ZRW2_9BURK|nr:protein of unknown function [Paraburkholderia dioscoreae]